MHVHSCLMHTLSTTFCVSELHMCDTSSSSGSAFMSECREASSLIKSVFTLDGLL